MLHKYKHGSTAFFPVVVLLLLTNNVAEHVLYIFMLHTMDRTEQVLPFLMIENNSNKKDIAEHVLHIFMLHTMDRAEHVLPFFQ